MLKPLVAIAGLLALTLGAVALIAGSGPVADSPAASVNSTPNENRKDSIMNDKNKPGRADLKNRLTPEQYRVTQECGTEAPFSGKYYYHKDDGTYRCVVCTAPLFTSDTKYESGSGWPSFFRPVSDTAVTEKRDTSHGMVRIEINCRSCGAHLGHVFPDGPQPTGLRYCVNSASLNFAKDSSIAGPADTTDPGKK